MESTAGRAIAVVGVGAVLPDAPDADAFWRNVKEGRYSISDVPKERWDPDLYYDPDPKAPDKSYTKIGGWVREFEWEPLKWRLPIPPKVGDAMDVTQKWAILVVRQALADYGYPDRKLDPERTAVIFGNAMGGDTHLYSSARILFPEYAEELDHAPSFGALPAEVRAAVLEELQQGIGRRLPPITEDTMPGELSNIVAGRIAALYDFRGPNFTTDAACASAVAAIKAAIEGLIQHDYDAVLTGGIDANMSPASYVKFCKIGALSATGSRPYAEGADGFVMGEGAVTFLMKRLADAERDGDRIYAVIRGIGASSDGRGKGITAPNPAGQKLAVRRAWQNAGLAPQPGDLVEGHGTSTAVGDVVEVQSMIEVFRDLGLPPGSVSLGSVKSNIGHLKGGAGAVGILKAAMALYEKVLPPSINYERPNPGLDWASSPFVVNTALRPWDADADDVRRVGASAFGFGGTNFHTVLEEYVPGRLDTTGSVQVRGAEVAGGGGAAGGGAGGGGTAGAGPDVRAPLRGALLIGGESDGVVRAELERVLAEARAGRAPEPKPPRESDLRAPVRLAIDYGDAEELAGKAKKALEALEQGQSNRWRALRSKGVFLGRGPAVKVAFLFSGQGSQYVNMLSELRDSEVVVADTFAEADAVMEPLLGRPLTEHIYVDAEDEAAVAAAEEALKQTAITQPAVLATEMALARVLGAYGIVPDMTMGHSLGEYGALVAAGALTFPDALKAVSARGKEMTRIAFEDNGTMAAVFGPLDHVQDILDGVDGYVVIANINSTKECVIGGATKAVEAATAALQEAGYRVTPLPVSHAFHTEIVAPASGALAAVLERLGIEPPSVPTIANISGDFYPAGPGAETEMVGILSRQVGSPVQFVKGLQRLYDAGARVFVELGPKRALTGFVSDVLGDHDGVVPLFTNHPRLDDATGVNIALCGLYAAGLGTGVADVHTAERAPAAASAATAAPGRAATPVMATAPTDVATPASAPAWPAAPAAGPYEELGRLFAEFLDRGMAIYRGDASAPAPTNVRPGASELIRIGVTGAALGLPGTERVFDERNLRRILDGGQFIVPLPHELRRAMADHHIVRLVKGNGGQAHFETIDDPADVVKLAGRGGELDLAEEYGFPEDRLQALDRVTRLAIAAGLDALRDAGIPLVQRYRTTTTGSRLPDGWVLPEEMRDDTGIIFASAFPGLDSLMQIVEDYHQDAHRRQQLADLRELRARARNDDSALVKDLDGRIVELEQEIEANPYVFDRRFLFRVLNMGHSQFAEYIGARGPNVGTNGACASGTQAVAMAQDWIQTGRCRRVIVISADDITTDHLMPWFGSAFLASGAAAADERVEDAAIPFDRRRHGLIIGMGGAALVVERLDVARDRGIQPITEVLGTVMANSAFHGSRLNVEHIIDVMEELVSGVEARWGLDRRAIAEQIVFVSHETYTPARGGSASAEILALRKVFGDAFDRIIIANTKGYTGHPMAVAMEDALAVKMLETGIVPPVANFHEVDPELGELNLSTGGSQPKLYSLRLGAGFGSQIAMDLMRWVPAPDGARHAPEALGHAYRVIDAAAWKAFLQRATGSVEPEIEIERRTLRVRAGGPVQQAGVEAKATRPDAGGVETTTAGRIAEPAAASTGSPAPASRPATAAASAAPAAATGAATAAAAYDPVAAQVLAIVAEKTGYPPDMLDLELDLEADLGIDTVKQAEMFAAVREEWDIERDETVALRDYPTLARVIDFVREKRPDLMQAGAGAGAVASPGTAEPTSGSPAPAVPSTSAAVPAPASGGAATGDRVAAKILAIVAEKTGYPEDMLDLALDLEADLGIDTVKQAEMFAAVREEWGIERDETVALRDYPTLARVIEFVYEKRPDLATAVPAAVASPGTAARTSSSAAPAVPSTSAAAPAATPSGGRAATGDPVAAKILAIVAEKTGYPEDMLELELDLEADLGIDTVKQAEMFAAVREEWGIDRDDDLALRDYPTLARVIEFVYEKRPDLMQAGAGAGATRPRSGGSTMTESAAHAATSAGQPASHMQAAVAVSASAPASAAGPTADSWAGRVPVPVLRPPLDVTSETGVGLAEGERVIVFPDRGGVGRALINRLEDRGVQVLVVEGTPSAEDLTTQLNEWTADGPVRGVYWLPALDAENLSAFDAASWREALRVRVKLLYATMRALYDTVSGAGTFLVSGTRLGGMHGYDAAGAVDPLGGAVTGFTKAFKREKPEALVKAVDFAPSRKTAALADLLIEETLRDPGVVEVGHRDGRRWTVALAQRSADGATTVGRDAASRTVAAATEMSGTPLVLGPDSVFVVTGAAGSITSAIIAGLAATSRATFHLLDLTPEPDRDDADLRRVVSDRDALKRDIFERLKASGDRATPALVEKELASLERSAAALAAIEAVEKAGGTAHYHVVNLLDAGAVAAVVRRIRQASGRVDALVHAAGIEISRLLPDKEPGEFDVVFDVKADGLFHLLSAFDDMPLGAVVVFSSIAARFGNAGQADYSAANDLMCKVVSSFRSTRPDTLGIAIDWTAWADIGMAARGSIPAIMKQAGIDMLAPDIGIPVVRHELTGGTKGEVVIAGSLGIMVQELDDTGGLDPGRAQSLAARGPMIGAVRSMGVHSGLVVETELDPSAQPFLHDHQIADTPVLPGVMGIEAMAETAGLLFPDMRVAAIEHVEFHAPFKFYRGEPRTVTVQASFRQDDDDIVADCRLLGSRLLHGRSEPEMTTHFSAQVRLQPAAGSGGHEAHAVKVPAQPSAGTGTVCADDIYRLYFHGPAYQVLAQAWQDDDVIVGRFAEGLPPNHMPPEQPTLAGPRLVELCFQTAGLRELAADARMGLPYRIERLELLNGGEGERDDLVALARTGEDGAFDVDLADQAGNVRLSLRGYRTMALPDAPDEAALSTLRTLVEPRHG